MMRKLIVMAMVVGLVGVGGYARSASAGVSIDLVFTSHNGSAITQTDTVTAAPGDTLLMKILMFNSQPLSFSGLSLNYDLDSVDRLDPLPVLAKGLGFHNWPGVSLNKAGSVHFAPIGSPSTTPAGGSPTSTFIGTFGSSNSADQTNFLQAPAGAFAGGYAVGTVQWKVTGGLAPGSPANILSGLFNTGVDAFVDNNFNLIVTGLVFNGATVNAVPEPGTAALLGFGLVGLVLAGRRNRA